MKIRELLDRIEGKAPKGAKRSSKWRKVRKVHLKVNPTCAICESKKRVEVHHIIPFHLAQDQELEPDNLVSLCQNKKYGIHCHLLVGHLGNYKRINLNCKLDIITWHIKLKG